MCYAMGKPPQWQAFGLVLLWVYLLHVLLVVTSEPGNKRRGHNSWLMLETLSMSLMYEEKYEQFA